MTPRSVHSGAEDSRRALFLTPEPPSPGTGGGGLRSACLLEFLRGKYEVEIASFTLPHHSKRVLARLWRNGWRLVRGVPPLLDRFSGLARQLSPVLDGRHFRVGVIEHFWCAPYAAALRPHCDVLILNLHNIESELAASHARATQGLESAAFRRFATAYRKLEKEWIPSFDLVLAASEEDRRRIDHPHVHIFPNALPEIAQPEVAETDSIVFSGNMEYHPNIEAVRWFRSRVWPRVRERYPNLEWRLAGRNEDAVMRLVSGDPRIKTIGPMDDAVATLAASKVCIVPLLSGSGTRFKILEAWAAGRAVVSTAIGAEGLGAQPGVHLLIADAPEAFGEAVVRLLGDEDLRKRLGAAGRALYLDRYSWPMVWRDLEQVLT